MAKRDNSTKLLPMTFTDTLHYKLAYTSRLKLLESLIYKDLFIAKHETHRSYCS